jgi:hypothetical protein
MAAKIYFFKEYLGLKNQVQKTGINIRNHEAKSQGII